MITSPSRPRRSGVAVFTLAALGLAAAAAGPLAFSSASPVSASVLNGMNCPPAIQKLNVPIDSEYYDADNPAVTTSISTGALPPGISVRDSAVGGHYSGAPTKTGRYDFSLTVTDQYTNTQSINCIVDVVPTDSKIERLSGEDRYTSAVRIADAIETDTAPLIYIASGENFADALSASAIAAQRGAPLLLTPRGDVPNLVYNTVSSLDPTNIVVVGGADTLNQNVIDQLKRAEPTATITRIDGVDRYAVSRNLIQHPQFGAMASTSLFVATGQVFADALAASPAAATVPTPVLLVNGPLTALSAEEKALIASRGVTKATVFGGSDTVSTGIENDLRATAGTADRIEGVNRYVGSAKVVEKFFPTAGPSGTVYLATGATYPDALAGGVLAGVKKAPILLVSKSCMAAEVAAQVRRLNPAKIVLLGGPNSLDATLGTLPVCP
ncbi:MAG: cell wall-binding repeat-containing protein [Herbiconiux sp.]|nr:cell wall-binding repeat-containing protein [Herbiconiux sp.]